VFRDYHQLRNNPALGGSSLKLEEDKSLFVRREQGLNFAPVLTSIHLILRLPQPRNEKEPQLSQQHLHASYSTAGTKVLSRILP
jgi:hypothetical protein